MVYTYLIKIDDEQKSGIVVGASYADAYENLFISYGQKNFKKLELEQLESNDETGNTYENYTAWINK